MKKIILKKLLLVLTCLLSFTSLSAANFIKVNVGEQVLMYASESGVDYRWVIFNDDQGYVSDCYGGNGYPDYCLNTHKPTPPGVEIQVKCVIYEMEAGHKVPRNEDWFYITIVENGTTPSGSTSELYYTYDSYYAVVVKPQGKTYAGDIVIPETVALGGYTRQVIMIGPQAFMDSKGLTSVTGNSIVRTTDEAFKDCNNLTSVNLPLSDLRGDAIFSGCINLKSVILYDYATELYKQTFYNCEKLPSYEIPSMVKTIGEEVFRGCNCFTEISLPKSVESVGDHAISDCANLKTIVIEGAPNTSSSGYPNLGVQFCNLPKLKDFYCKYEIPPAISVSGSFKNTKINYATLHVPSSAVDLYKSTAPWSGFASIVGDADATGINSVTSNSDDERIYDLQGNRLDKKKKGLNIIRKSDGRTVKVLVK